MFNDYGYYFENSSLSSYFKYLFSVDVKWVFQMEAVKDIF